MIATLFHIKVPLYLTVQNVPFQYNNSRMYFNSGLFGSPGGFGSAAAAAAAAVQSMSPGGGSGAGSGSGMPHHLFDAASFRSEHGFPG